MRFFSLIVTAIAAGCARGVTQLAVQEPPCLPAGTQLFRQIVQFDTPKSYKLCELTPATEYEVRISYPATSPAVFTLRLEQAEVSLAKPSQGDSELRRVRRLNTAKLELSTDALGQVITADGTALPSSALLIIQAEVEGVAHSLQPTEVMFNIMLDPKTAGIPSTSLSMLGVGGVLLLVIIAGVWLMTRTNVCPCNHIAAQLRAETRRNE